MTKDFLDNRERHLAIQALIDGSGYPKSDEAQRQIGYSSTELHKLTDELLQNHNKKLTDTEKQVILNCLAGALHYVTTDIPSLYDISEAELKEFKENLEKRWGMHSTYSKD
ncbi:hypothetical protein [Candidatus Methanoperedens nitratireducens]|uniref:Uncharacterized protein n=1 Tax=Candidatus Methanoperedens nitratireducens TaxID=1392998 RepID=A0A284VPK5_9EURY|nr:hypothetical protein [Candidatus Methanoperedens nitroreducens]SNQ61211.1 hypothetical protein MNV_250028 [Candidatus Methanoperedens nitroreducens]